MKSIEQYTANKQSTDQYYRCEMTTHLVKCKDQLEYDLAIEKFTNYKSRIQIAHLKSTIKERDAVIAALSEPRDIQGGM